MATPIKRIKKTKTTPSKQLSTYVKRNNAVKLEQLLENHSFTLAELKSVLPVKPQLATVQLLLTALENQVPNKGMHQIITNYFIQVCEVSPKCLVNTEVIEYLHSQGVEINVVDDCAREALLKNKEMLYQVLYKLMN